MTVSITVQDAPDYTGNVYIVGQLQDLTITGSVTVTSGDINIAGPLTADGYVAVEITKSITIDVNITNSTLNITGDVTVSSGSVDISGPLTTEGNVSVAIQQSIQLDVNVTNSVINIQGSVDANITNATLTIQGDVNITNSVLNVNITNEALRQGSVRPILAFDRFKPTYMELPFISLGTRRLTVGFWVYHAAVGTEYLYVRDDPENSNYGVAIKINSDATVTLVIGDGTSTESFTTTTTVPRSEWHLVGWRIDLVGGEIYFYMDGENKESFTPTLTSMAYNDTYHLIGTNAVKQTAASLRGYLKYIGIWNYHGSPLIKSMYERPEQPDPTYLAEYYKLQEGSGTAAKGLLGHDATIVDGIWVSESGAFPALVNVNITANQVTLDINITAQDIDLKIYTPSGRWTTVSELMSSASEAVTKEVSAGSEVEFFHLTGRGRLMHVGLYVYRIGSSDLISDTRLRIYIDGESSPSIDLRLYDLDILNGMLLEAQRIYNFNRVDYGTDYYVMFAQSVNPTGAAVWGQYDHVNGRHEKVGAFLRPEIEFTSELSVRIYNANSDGSVVARIVIVYGEYL